MMDAYTFNIPFVWSDCLESPNNPERIPNVLPIRLYTDVATGILSQSESKIVKENLQKAYSIGSNLSGTMDDFGIGNEYARDFQLFLKETIPSFSKKKILEIGCGTGYLLHYLEKQGAICVGIEPGKQAEYGKKKFGVNIINDFFPHPDLEDKTFDIIILFLVLEHITNPVSFLQNLKKYLTRKGRIIVAVPDCEPYMKNGDISMLFHEHFSYFTKQTLSHCFSLAGFSNIHVKKSPFAGSLYSSATIACNDKMEKDPDVTSCIHLNNSFFTLSKIQSKKMEARIKKIISQNKSIGIYVPGRIINVCVAQNIPLKNIRFFDDNKLLYKKYYPGINIPIECREDMVKDPVDVIIIYSDTFSEKIKKNIQLEIKDPMEIITWENIFTNR